MEPTVVLNLYSEEETVKSAPVVPVDNKLMKSSASELRFAAAERPKRTYTKRSFIMLRP